ncbi:MAG: hypothetical protein ACOZBL_03945 [Patescibacteria group bacterium]
MLNQNKPLDAFVQEDLNGYCLSPIDFEKIDFDDQKQLYASLILFLSDRVYKMNEIMSMI